MIASRTEEEKIAQLKSAVVQSPSRGHLILVFLGAFLLVVLIQRLQGAYQSELGGHPDEAAHCVTGLFIHDAIRAELDWAFHGMHGSPVAVGKAFADNYYSAYPKIGLGIWPPFFYTVQSAWITAFPASRSSLLLLMAAISAGLALTLYKQLWEEFGTAAAAAGVALFLSLPLIQAYSAMVMAEMLSGLLMFSAAISLGRFFDRSRSSDAIAFGVFAALAILTKGTGLALALTALIALPFAARKEHFFSRGPIFAFVIVSVLAGPWTWFFRNQGKGGWEEPSPSWHFTRTAFPYYLWKTAICLGGLLLALALIGFMCRAMRRWAFTGKWTVLGSLVLSVCVFQSIAPAGKEARHLVSIMPALILFVFAGLQWIATQAQSKLGTGRNTLPILAWTVLGFFVLAGLAVGPKPAGFGSVGDQMAFSPFTVRQKGYAGFEKVASKLCVDGKKKVVLVSSDARGEGMLIAETALGDAHRPTYVVQRASKLMAASTWGGGSYQNYYQSEQALMKAIMDSPIEYLAIDCAVPDAYRKPHHEMLANLVRNHPEVFIPVMEVPLQREGVTQKEPIRVCRIDRNPRKLISPL